MFSLLPFSSLKTKNTWKTDFKSLEPISWIRGLRYYNLLIFKASLNNLHIVQNKLKNLSFRVAKFSPQDLLTSDGEEACSKYALHQDN